jgi:hypothetical protein
MKATWNMSVFWQNLIDVVSEKLRTSVRPFQSIVLGTDPSRTRGLASPGNESRSVEVGITASYSRGLSFVSHTKNGFLKILPGITQLPQENIDVGV